MAFMQRVVEHADYYDVSANHGETHCVPADVVGTPKTNADFSDYIDGTVDNPDDAPDAMKTGYIARMSAPGYMDCTPWAGFATRAEAEAYLTDYYGDDDTEEDN